MAIDLVTFLQLLNLSKEIPAGGKALVLGRQNFLSPTPGAREQRQKRVYQRMLEHSGHDIELSSLADEDGYCDSFFDFLGFSQTDYMDLSDYEGANVLHDLNQRIPDTLEEQYDFIFDGGTIEHIFNVPMAFSNVDRMLRPGGRILGINPANNWVGHGFYQFSPELVWSFWRDTMGYQVNSCKLNRMRDFWGRSAINLTSPEERGMKRDDSLRKLSEPGIYLMIYDITKTKTGRKTKMVQQSDYADTWRKQKE